jgi:enamine deaminase RidA (YjgF/YER057c/UK114 family)
LSARVGVCLHRRPSRHQPCRRHRRRKYFEAQCVQVFANVEAAFDSVDATWTNVVQFTAYLVDAQDVAKLMAYRGREFPGIFADGAFLPNALQIVDRLVQEPFLIEVQAIAAL